MLTRLATIAAIAAAVGAGLAAPAQAKAPDLAVTGCGFTGLYSDYTDGKLSGWKSYYSWNIRLTVTDGDGNAWFVTVDHNGEQGWMAANCVLFLS
jgi:hypothetical protein